MSSINKLVHLYGKERTVKCGALCFGGGRFIRSLMVPMFSALNIDVILIERGVATASLIQATKVVEVDVADYSGQITTSKYTNVVAVATTSDEHSYQAFLGTLSQCKELTYVVLGVTEQGLQANTEAINKLAEMLHCLYHHNKTKTLSLLNVDNVKGNGDKLSEYLTTCDFTKNQPAGHSAPFIEWLQTNVTAHNTMVDRITGHRPNCPTVPQTELLPSKALVIEDIKHVLPPSWRDLPGVVLRHAAGALAVDATIKLRVLNATHTVLVYVAALSGFRTVDQAVGDPLLARFVDEVFARDLVHVHSEYNLPKAEIEQVYAEWRKRIQNPGLGHSTFFVAQNALLKIQERLAPVLSTNANPSELFVFAIASIIRFLTPVDGAQANADVFSGRLDCRNKQPTGQRHEYASGLFVDGTTYTFRAPSETVAKVKQATDCTALASALRDVIPSFGTEAALPFLARVYSMVERMRGEGVPAYDLLQELMSAVDV